MRLVSDLTRRFTKRPHYDPRDLDLECEKIVFDFLTAKYGEAAFPISTDDLTILLEQETDDLDTMADLAELGDDVEGVTYFFRSARPRVRISKALWDRDPRQHRLRTTLTHELGHVHFHRYLYAVDESLQSFLESGTSTELRCFRNGADGRSNADWMEWQAGYASGALLMPASRTRSIANRIPIEAGESAHASAERDGLLVDAVSEGFQVSRDAARVRVSQLGLLAGFSPRLL
jgi:hypothetical protein